MKEWFKKYKPVIIGCAIGAFTGGVCMTIGGVWGMKYSENVFNEALKGAYKEGALKAFDKFGNELTDGYLFSWKHYNN